MKRESSRAGSSANRQDASSDESKPLTDNTGTNAFLPAPNDLDGQQGTLTSETSEGDSNVGFSKDSVEESSQGQYDFDNAGQTSFLSWKGRDKLNESIPATIGSEDGAQGLICHLIRPITILSHQRIKLKPHKGVLTMSNHFFITSTTANVPPKFDDRVIRMKNSQKLMGNSFVPSDNHIPIGRVSQKIFADSQMSYMEVKIGVKMDSSNNEYEFKDIRSFKHLFNASFEGPENTSKFQPVDLLVSLTLSKRYDGLIAVKEKITYKFNFNSSKTPYLQVLEPYIQAIFHPQEGNIASPYFYDEYVTVGHDFIKISRRTEVPGLAKITDFEKVLNLKGSFELQEDRIYSQDSKDMSKVLNSILFKNVNVKNKRALKHGKSVPDVRSDRSTPHILTSDKSDTPRDFSPGKCLSKPKGNKRESIQLDEGNKFEEAVKNQAPGFVPKETKGKKNKEDQFPVIEKAKPTPQKKPGFCLSDILQEVQGVSSDSIECNIIKRKKRSSFNKIEEFIKNDYGIREAGKIMSDNTMDEVSSLKEDRTASPLESQEDFKIKKKRKKPCLQMKTSDMEENGGVSADEMAYFKALGQAVSLPSGAVIGCKVKEKINSPQEKQKMGKETSEASLMGLSSLFPKPRESRNILKKESERTAKAREERSITRKIRPITKEVSLNADVQGVPVQLKMSMEVNRKGKTAGIRDVELWMGDKRVFNSDQNL